MSEPPIAVTIVDSSGAEDTIVATAAFDGVPEALDAIDVLLCMWAFDQEDQRHIEVVRT